MKPWGTRATNGPAASQTSQIFAVMRLELVKYARSRRVVAILMIGFVLIGWSYGIHTAVYGEPFAGTGHKQLELAPYSNEYYPGFSSIGDLGGYNLDPETLVIEVNGTPLESSQFFLLNDSYMILFVQNLVGCEVYAHFEFAVSSEEFAVDLLVYMQVGVAVTAIFLGSDSIVREFTEHTGFVTFVNPVRKHAVLLGKFLAGMSLGAMAILLWYVAIAGLSYVTLESVAVYLPLSFGYALLYLFVCLSFVLLSSSVSRGVLMSVVIPFLTLVLILPGIQVNDDYPLAHAWLNPSFEGETVYYSMYFEDYPRYDSTGALNPGVPDLSLSALVLLAYGFIFLVASTYVLHRREFSE